MQDFINEARWMDADSTRNALNKISFPELETEFSNSQTGSMPTNTTDLTAQSQPQDSDASFPVFTSNPYKSCSYTKSDDFSGSDCDSYTIPDDFPNFVCDPAAIQAAEESGFSGSQDYTIDVDNLLNYLPPVEQMDWQHVSPSATPTPSATPDHHVPGAWAPCGTPNSYEDGFHNPQKCSPMHITDMQQLLEPCPCLCDSCDKNECVRPYDVFGEPIDNGLQSCDSDLCTWSGQRSYNPVCFCQMCVDTRNNREHAGKVISAIEEASKSILVVNDEGEDEDNARCFCKHCVAFEEEEYEAAHTGTGVIRTSIEVHPDDIETQWWAREG
jgi:hypothetical protein